MMKYNTFLKSILLYHINVNYVIGKIKFYHGSNQMKSFQFFGRYTELESRIIATDKLIHRKYFLRI